MYLSRRFNLVSNQCFQCLQSFLVSFKKISLFVYNYKLAGLDKFLLYSTSSRVSGIKLDNGEAALAPIVIEGRAFGVSFYAGS